MRTIQDVLDETTQAVAAEQLAQIQDNQPTRLEWILSQLSYWKRLYLKKNQQRNYFRITRIVLPGTEEYRGQWVQKFQFWIQGEMKGEYILTADAYDTICNLPGWVQSEQGGMQYAILRPTPQP